MVVCTEETFAGQPCRRLTLPGGDSVLVALQGAHVLSWRSGGRELLYLSPRNVWDGRSAIRGGVPVCFPQFNQRGPLPKHGLARNSTWQALSSTQDQGALTLEWRDDDASRALWPQRFTARLTVALTPGALRVTLDVDNTDAQPLAFSGALHTYFAVDDIAQASLHGLAEQAEWDAVADRHGVAADVLRFAGEFDRVYAAASRPLLLDAGGHRLRIAQSESWGQHVVWNPGADKCATLADMPADGHRRMLCVEAAQVYAPVVVPSGAQWRGWQHLSLV